MATQDPYFSVFILPSPFGDTYQPSAPGYTQAQIQALSNQYVLNKYEAKLVNYLLNTDFEVFYDVGAAFGYFSMLAASKPTTKTVIALEAHPFGFGLLWHTTRNAPKIWPHHCFITNEETQIPKVSGNITNMYATTAPEETSNYTPNRRKLDDFYVPQQTGIIKIDVEGYELGVLQSAPKMLSDPNIRVIVEIHYNRVDPQAIIDLFATYGKSVQEKFHSGSIVRTLLFG